MDESRLEMINGNENWFDINNKFHRVDGPAFVTRRYKFYSIHGDLHREDGPAVIYIDGYEEWYLNNKKYTKEDHLKEMRKRKINSLKESL